MCEKQKISAYLKIFSLMTFVLAFSGCTTFRSALPRPINDVLRPSSSAKIIRVAIIVSKPFAVISVIGPGTFYDKIHHKRIQRFSSIKKAAFTVQNGNVFINGYNTKSSHIIVLPDMPQSIKVQDKFKENIVYRGRIDIIAEDKNFLTVVNTLPIDEYIMGVVPRETFPAWPQAALKTQAVAARTYAVSHMQNSNYENYDIISPIHQLYGGATAEALSTTKAVLDTQGEILTYNGKVLCTFFYTCCGGKTEEAKNIFSTIKEYPPAVASPYCKGTKNYAWNYSVALENCSQKLSKAGKPLAGRILKVKIIERFKSGRAAKIKFSSKSKSVVLTGEECRRILGYNNIRSTLFKVRIKNGRLQFVGRGWGHAVGMCQWCSEVMAEKGFDYEQILKHFYPGTEIQR
ncbi:SpoIID/LytB domain-containing protein [bacterium]|nr:SpoIID/LytB domain-containing protein [bacterium]